MHPVLSVVVPVYNEEDVLPLLVERLRPALDSTGVTYEVVAVNDGSTDSSAVIMQRIHREWPQFRIVRLRANAGHQAAISAGLARADGDYMVTIDADLQDPPETIVEMLDKARNENLDVVYGVRNDRSTDTAFKRNTAQAFYATLRRLSKTDAPANAGDFRLMSRATVDAINALPTHHRVLRLVVPQLGFPSGEVYYKREERAAGETKYPLSKMIALSIDSLTSGSMAPLRLATFMGMVGFIGAVAIFLYALVSSVAGRAVPGWTSTVMAVAAVGAVQLVCLGILGEYVGRMYTMMQRRPTYFVAHDTGVGNVQPTGRHEAPAEEPGYAADMYNEVDIDGSLDSPEAAKASAPARPDEAQRRSRTHEMTAAALADDRMGAVPVPPRAGDDRGDAVAEDMPWATGPVAQATTSTGSDADEKKDTKATGQEQPARGVTFEDAEDTTTPRAATPHKAASAEPTGDAADAPEPVSGPDPEKVQDAIDVPVLADGDGEEDDDIVRLESASNDVFSLNVPASAFDRAHENGHTTGPQPVVPSTVEARRRARPWQDAPSDRNAADRSAANRPVIDAAARQAVRRTSANKLTPGSDETGK